MYCSDKTLQNEEKVTPFELIFSLKQIFESHLNDLKVKVDII